MTKEDFIAGCIIIYSPIITMVAFGIGYTIKYIYRSIRDKVINGRVFSDYFDDSKLPL